MCLVETEHLTEQVDDELHRSRDLLICIVLIRDKSDCGVRSRVNNYKSVFGTVFIAVAVWPSLSFLFGSLEICTLGNQDVLSCFELRYLQLLLLYAQALFSIWRLATWALQQLLK
ncbi:hypothetical protein O6H91_06G014600 [Diphasiastrum complanatum]|uniref:Uncharacterized protein n=1 Tax=Diphasiastrum complanatum TaxID=34168 RepID=A0ACC2DAY9_DIPCM|nr:hypothetical protein O6H91_06G014600 [Diphasiastrum complanatum]